MDLSIWTIVSFWVFFERIAIPISSECGYSSEIIRNNFHLLDIHSISWIQWFSFQCILAQLHSCGGAMRPKLAPCSENGLGWHWQHLKLRKPSTKPHPERGHQQKAFAQQDEMICSSTAALGSETGLYLEVFDSLNSQCQHACSSFG